MEANPLSKLLLCSPDVLDKSALYSSPPIYRGGVSAASGLDLKELAQHEPHLLSTDKTEPFI